MLEMKVAASRGKILKYSDAETFCHKNPLENVLMDAINYIDNHSYFQLFLCSYST